MSASAALCWCVCVRASCQLPRSAANPPWLVPTGNWAQTGAKQTQEGNMAHGNPPSLSPILLLSSLSHPPLSTLINCFFFFAPNTLLILSSFSASHSGYLVWAGSSSLGEREIKKRADNGAMGEVQTPAEGTEQWLKWSVWRVELGTMPRHGWLCHREGASAWQAASQCVCSAPSGWPLATSHLLRFFYAPP